MAGNGQATAATLPATRGRDYHRRDSPASTRSPRSAGAERGGGPGLAAPANRDILSRLVRRRNRLWLLECHFLAATGDLSRASLDAEYLAATSGALVSLAQLTCHGLSSLDARVGLLLEFHRLAAAIDFTVARLGDDELAAALGAVVPFTNLVSHYLCHLPLDTSFGIIISKPRWPSQGE